MRLFRIAVGIKVKCYFGESIMKNIIFDFGGVLLEWDSDYFYKQYFENEEAMNKFYNDTNIKVVNKSIDKGIPFDVALKELVIKFPEHEEPILLWKKAWNKMIGNEIVGSINVLYKLHEQGYNLYGLTNWSGETFPYVFYKYDFFHLFKDIVVSGRENCIKPEPDIYKLCLVRNNLNPRESIFIDDNVDNVIAANQQGITGIHFTNAEELHKSLINLGIKI